MVKKFVCNVGDLGSILGLGRSPEEENGNPLQYSCLENPMDGRAWQATVCGVIRVRQDLATKPPPPSSVYLSAKSKQYYQPQRIVTRAR